jgi:dipeptidyl aminopeptidase/acylaminoacyl peptidase
MTRTIVAAAVIGLALLAAPAVAQQRRFTADDLPKIVRISEPRFSPDGKTIAIVVARANLKEDRWDTELDLVDVATHQLRVMTRERRGLNSPRWSPAGDQIAFLADDADKNAQIYLLDLRGGDARQVTHGKAAISVLAWRPDGQALAYAAPEEQPEKKDEAKFDDAFEVGNNNYTERASRPPTHLWSVSLADGAVRQLTSGSWSLPRDLPPAGPPSQIAWTPDGRTLVFVKADTPATGDGDTSRVALLDVASGAIRPLAPSDLQQDQPQLSPDGGTVAYAFARDGRRHNEAAVYLAPVTGGPGKDAAYGLDRGLTLLAWAPTGRALLLAGNDGARAVLWMQILGGAASRLELGELNPSPPAASVGPHDEIAFTATDQAHPAELYYLPRPGSAPVKLTHLQTVTDGVTLGRQETVRWTSDGKPVVGVLTYPPDYFAGKKLPLVLYLHGGPTSASLQGFTPPAQIFAARGWLVFEPNYRGSNNAGAAFEMAIEQDAGAGPGRDVMSGVELLKQRGLVDETRIAVSGWSYGGYMTSWLLGNYPQAWRAAVAGAPVTDLVDQYTLSDNNIQRAAAYGPSPFVGDNLKAYAAQSPITYAWRIKAPTLIMSDVGDWRVTTTQAYKLYHALRDNNVPVKFIAYPVPGHSPADPIRARDVFRRWTAWLALYLDDQSPPPSDPVKGTG